MKRNLFYISFFVLICSLAGIGLTSAEKQVLRAASLAKNPAPYLSGKAVPLLRDNILGTLVLQTECDGCSRRYTAEISSDAGEMNETSIWHRLNSAVITPCFRALAKGDEIPRELRPVSRARPYEYYFLVSYEEGLKDEIKSRLQIDLFFNGESEEHVETWISETDNPDAGYRLHRNRMFDNPSAVLKKYWPMEITVLNPFEKRPYTCEIEPEKESVNPGEEIEIVLSDIVDIEGQPSREFNRLIVQAKNGDIFGGTPLAADEDLKVFRVGDGTLKFRYKAPDSCEEKEDTIFVCNSCDILRDDLWPLTVSELKDKIAEKEISLMCADWSGILTFSFRSKETDTETVSGFTITNQKEIISQGSASVELYYDREYDEFREVGAPSGSYTHNVTEVETVKGGGSSGRTENTSKCSGGYQDGGPDARSFLDIHGREYELQIYLTTDPDNDCKGTTKVYLDGDLVEKYGFQNPFVLSEFLVGLTDGKTIEGQKTVSGEGWVTEISWSFRSR